MGFGRELNDSLGALPGRQLIMKQWTDAGISRSVAPRAFPVRILIGEMEALEMLKRSLLVLGLVGALATGAMADVMISYNSDIDRDPATPNVIDLDVTMGDVATITVNLAATAGEDGLGGVGFDFAGAVSGSGGAATVDNGGFFTIGGFMYADPMQDVNSWFTVNDLPTPQGAAFFPGAALDFPAELATFTITADALSGGAIEQATGPSLADRNAFPLSVGAGGGAFSVHVTPEPATFVLLAIGGIALLRRR